MISKKSFQNVSLSETYFCLTVLVVLAIGVTDAEDQASNIRRLMRDLLRNYDKFARPVKNASVPVPVKIQLTPISLMEVDEKEEKMVLNAWVPLKWRDEHLQWSMDKYDGIKRIHLTENEIWHPNILVINGAPATDTSPWHRSRMIVYYNGNVYWALSSTLSTRCPMIFLTSKDERLCNVSFASWAYSNAKIELKLYWNDVQMIFLKNNNSLWEIKNISTSLQSMGVDPLDTSTVATFTVKINRRYDFTKDVTRGPRVISVVLILLMFWISPKSKKKLTLGCLIILVVSGEMLYLSSTIVSPILLSITVSELRVTLFTATSALMIEVIVLRVSGLGDTIRLNPTLVRVLKGILGRVICTCPESVECNDNGKLAFLDTDNQSVTADYEWLLVATAVDRCCFFIYAIVYFVFSFVI